VLLRTIVLFLLTFSILFAKQNQTALDTLNSIRQNVGLVQFKSNKKLDKAAKSHADYLVRQQKNGHYEKKGWRGYTGRTPSDRVVKAGYPTRDVMENVTVNTETAHESIDVLFAAIYHRFVFLNFDKDEIGIGRSISKRKKRSVVSSFVYDIGPSKISALCNGYYVKKNGYFYMNNLCKNSLIDVPQYLFLETLNETRLKNSSVVLFPPPGATDVLPVFYTENPHPLPGSKVSGYPVSVQFNPAFYKKVKLKKFRLFDAEGKEIKKCKILTQRNDKNHRFKKLQFALMPLKRLEYGVSYQVEFEALADGKRVKRSWKFTTKEPQIILYFEPRSNKDILSDLRHSTKLQTTYLDLNTLLVTIPDRCSRKQYTLRANGRRVVFRCKP